jgi:hypothetical protein
MHTPTHHHAPLRLGGVFVGTPAPATPTMPSPNADADLVALCDSLAAVAIEVEALLDASPTIEDEERNMPAADALSVRWSHLLDGIWDRGSPTTAEGAKAMARAFSAIAPRKLDGTIEEGGPNWLAFEVCEFFADEDAGT